MRFRPRRALIEQAIHLAKNTPKGKDVIVLDPLEGVSVDMAFFIITVVNRVRDKYDTPPIGRELKTLVEQTTFRIDLPPDRKRAYVLIVMRYYNMIGVYVQKIRTERGLPREKRRAFTLARPVLVLTG